RSCAGPELKASKRVVVRPLVAKALENLFTLFFGVRVDGVLRLLPHHPNELEGIPVEKAIAARVADEGAKTAVDDTVHRGSAEPALVETGLQLLDVTGADRSHSTTAKDWEHFIEGIAIRGNRGRLDAWRSLPFDPPLVELLDRLGWLRLLGRRPEECRLVPLREPMQVIKAPRPYLSV